MRVKDRRMIGGGKLGRLRFCSAGRSQVCQLDFALLRLRKGFVFAVAGVFGCAGRAVYVPDSDAVSIYFGFGVAEGGRFFAMHADGERAFFWEVRSVQRAQPMQASEVFGGQGALEDGLPRLLGGFFVEAGRSP